MNKLTWPMVGLIGVLGAIAVALAAVAHWDAGGILGLVGILAGIGGGAAVGGAVAGRVEDVHSEVQGVAQQVNGSLTERIEAGADRASAAVLAELRKQGVIK
jgi:hypothetical protein